MWDRLLQDALSYLRDQQDRLRRDFGLSEWERYDYYQDEGLIKFSSNGRVGLVADMQVVGSTSNETGTWLWAWDNPSIETRVQTLSREVLALGKAKGFKQLVEPKWKGDERDGWEMTAVAAFISQADGAYRSPSERGALFLVLTNPRLVSPDSRQASKDEVDG